MFELMFDDGLVDKSIDSSVIHDAIKSSVADLYGVYGSACISTHLQGKKKFIAKLTKKKEAFCTYYA